MTCMCAATRPKSAAALARATGVRLATRATRESNIRLRSTVACRLCMGQLQTELLAHHVCGAVGQLVIRVCAHDLSSCRASFFGVVAVRSPSPRTPLLRRLRPRRLLLSPRPLWRRRRCAVGPVGSWCIVVCGSAQFTTQQPPMGLPGLSGHVGAFGRPPCSRPKFQGR